MKQTNTTLALGHVGYQPTGAVDGEPTTEPTEQEKAVQAWRESGGKRVETGVVRFGDDWPGFFVRGDDAMGVSQGAYLLREMVKYGVDSGYVAFSEEFQIEPALQLLERMAEVATENPAEPLSLPHTAVSGHGGGNSSGGAELDGQAGEICNVDILRRRPRKGDVIRSSCPTHSGGGEVRESYRDNHSQVITFTHGITYHITPSALRHYYYVKIAEEQG